MLGWKSASWFYPNATGDLGRDRNARTVQFACFLLASALSAIAILNVIAREWGQTPLLASAVAGLSAAIIMNLAGRWEWAARTAILTMLLSAMLLVFEARDGFRSLAMLLFPGMLLLSVMLLDRASYMITAGIVLVAVATLGIAEMRGLTRAIPRVRSSTTYESIFIVDLNLLVFAVIGSRIARDGQLNVFDLRASIDSLSEANRELTETTEALSENQQQVVSIYNTVRDVIFHLAVEPEGRYRFVSVNAAFLRVTGLSRERVVGKLVNEVIPEPSLTIVLAKYRQAIDEHTVVLWEETSDYPIGRLSGEVSVTPVFDTTGTCTHLVGSVHDITEVKRAQEEAFARQKLETVGALANGIAHDFNNILGGVLAQADVALTELESGSVPAEELKAIRDAAIRGAEIVRELLIYAGTESPALVLLNVSQVVEEMLGLLKVSVSKRARIETDLAKNLPAVRANSARVSQLLMNLVTNASDAIGDRDGVIRVTTRRVTAGPGAPERRPLTERDYLQLEVSDTGCGMMPEIRAKVFEPFFSTKSMGRGIGLAVVDGIVRSLGGATELESESGKGTTFRISLPAAESDSQVIDRAEPGTMEAPRQSRVATVLIVEDEAPLRQAVSKMLDKTGAFVIEAADGGTALDALRTQENLIDVMVLDITIPGASSREVLEEAIRLRPDVRVIVTSAYSEDVAAVSLRGPVHHFLRKPYRMADLAELIQTIV
jgi:PAS domain S-box-containing protein